MLLKVSTKQVFVLLLIVWLSILLSQAQLVELVEEYVGFTFLGIVGAIFANATGAGGGVVFMPFFNQLGFSVVASVATSFAIQCCGMTAGALTWYAYYQRIKEQQQAEIRQWQSLSKVLLLTVPASVIGVWLVQFSPQLFAQFSNPNILHTGFGIFSMCLSLAIFATVFLLTDRGFNLQVGWGDSLALILIAFLGGGITAWLSIGVGELLAVYLIIRRFNVTFAIATAVIVSACSVWGGVVFHLLVSKEIYWPIVMFAGAGAIVGGILAKQLVLYFSAKNLKLFFAVWIFILGLTALPF